MQSSPAPAQATRPGPHGGHHRATEWRAHAQYTFIVLWCSKQAEGNASRCCVCMPHCQPAQRMSQALHKPAGHELGARPREAGGAPACAAAGRCRAGRLRRPWRPSRAPCAAAPASARPAACRQCTILGGRLRRETTAHCAPATGMRPLNQLRTADPWPKTYTYSSARQRTVERAGRRAAGARRAPAERGGARRARAWSAAAAARALR